jgi:HAD superfamily hydrolase (TIGR01509 family)
MNRSESNENRLPPRAVLWDLDGTLINSARAHWQAWHDEMAAQGIDLSFEAFMDTFGQRNDRVLRLWIHPDLTLEEIARISETKEIRFRESLRGQGMELQPGGAQWIQTLRTAGWKQALATMAGRENVHAVFAGKQGQYFEAVVTAEEVVRSKPDPDVFLLAASRLGVPPSRCVVVEDSPAGIEAARRAGMKSIGIGSTTSAADVSFLTLLEIPAGCFEQLIPEE